MELNLRFPENHQVIVTFDGQDTERLDFASPLSAADREEIRWYLETYAARYTTDVDDTRAEGIAKKFRQWGEDLFNAVFQHRTAQRLFNYFQDQNQPGRLLTISASHPAILSLPWELLRDPQGTYLFHENPRISIRRRLAGAGGGRRPFKVQVKDRLRLLFVVSRPSDAGFIDPRGEAMAVLNAIQQAAAGRVEVEFLRPATLDNLVARLEDSRQPPVDIVHFDGHGVFDLDGRFQEQAKHSDPVGLTKGGNENGGNIGYLLFEDKEGKKALITAETLGDMLNRQKVGLIVLSACQSAAMGGEDGEDAMGSVAARLTHAGIPTVLAMTHSVLVTTTQQLFAKFYQGLVSGAGMGEALDNARRDLYLNQQRGERQRGEQRVQLKLQDWFLPALYQAAGDTSLLQQDLNNQESGESPKWGNLPDLQEAGFFGRSRELWQIERWFVQGTRRLTVSGFGGQGKTYLVQEAGRWLHRTGMFEKVCFVDYAAFGGVDAVGWAVSTLATVLDESLIDGAAATQALRKQATLLILDNLETLPVETLRELLTVAKQWSEVGECRVLLTTRTPDFHHPDYPTQGSRKHISLSLRGLGQEDALAYFQSLIKLTLAPKFDPPKRGVLLELFKLVDFHPLSIGLLAKQLENRRPAELGQRLEALIAQTPDNPLLASLNLSLERLDAEAMQLLPRLGVFQGGAFDINLLEITEISESQWQTLRPALEATGLIQPEYLPGVRYPFLKFHPTLAPALWQRLSPEAQTELLAHYQEWYYQISSYLYFEDSKNPHIIRAIAERELPNLLYAVNGTLNAGIEWAVEFVKNVNRFLGYFGLNRDRTRLNQRIAQLTGEVGSDTWYLSRSSSGEQLFNAGRYQQAAQVFSEILAELGEQPSYNRCNTLGWLGRCLRLQRQTAQAAEIYRQALVVAQQLEQSDNVKQLMGTSQTELADTLTDMGDYGEARIAYEAGLDIAQEVGDPRNAAVSNFQLGTLAMQQGNLSEAEQRYREALTTFQQLNEPATEAKAWHNLGIVYEEGNLWDAAEDAYRKSAQIKESLGNLADAASTWQQLGNLNALTGNLGEAEAWFRKALKQFQQLENQATASQILSNLAFILQNQPHRLSEARQLAEEALAIKKTLDPAAAKIWNAYDILADIADKQGDSIQAKEYRRQARQEKAAFAGTQYELRKYRRLIAGVVAVVDNAEIREQLEIEIKNRAEDLPNLVAPIRRILAGERDENILCEPLNLEHSMIISAILRGIADPQSLEALLNNS
ncbi:MULTISPECIES: CHAT domain-containing protein [unclassified Tolypothrix]|uniref:CHAT domain-containing protein n=1 Tax=unclassified Tolypothrix TaxID=2649714 RepID=UPI0005EAA9FB|nr:MULTISPECIES: CHAT domain-containing protein [unclassified Tolypothrix]BAY90122.1 TPR domain protein [Microchaete diplosiphon NIES-3275]EKE97373.1 tetratricopeptide repeat protein [Tolypothrix sp. PCC 7601]MBE9083030.1 CHAT domain-containing protein [Tolypothrix sp. LEGE 11397]UYD24337.1 CHAT domain-containing protein [Tolypothrix sp. PCC 7712]UYD33429.1 CHAT domain-containing protein [Tolypothrix sp. PCC 7601]